MSKFNTTESNGVIIIPFNVYQKDIKDLKNYFKEQLDLLYSEKRKPSQIDDLISIKEAALLLKVSVATIHNWKSQNIIKSFRKGRKVYFKKQELIKSLESLPTK